MFLGLDAFFVGVIQILVYAGAVMVLFLFIIMLLDIKDEQKRAKSLMPVAAGLALVVAFVIQLLGILARTPNKIAPRLDQDVLSRGCRTISRPAAKSPPRSTEGKLPDVQLIGLTFSPTTTCRSKSSACFCSSPPSAWSSSPNAKPTEPSL